METLITVYWVCFGLGVVYIVVTGALGMVSHGMEGVGADHGDFAIDHDAGFEAQTGDAGFEGADIEADGGMDGIEAHAEMDSGHGEVLASHDVSGSQSLSSFAVLSPLNIAGFLAAFGGTGLLSTYFGLQVWASMGIAALGGVIMVILLWLIIGKWLFGMQGSSQAHQSEMFGLEAEVLTPVEHEMSGEIAYVLEGTRFTAPARLIKEGRVEKHEIVRIRKLVNNIVYVEEKKKLLS